MIKNVIMEVGGRRWLVEEAESENAALNAIAFARVSGSVGSKSTRNDRFIGGDEVVIASVHQINSDGTKRQPYTMGY